ncbi:ATP-binding protein [Sinorhizobium sp. RAC02]|uniref:AAA family ATPase n=1 Tax=Sinorhizobium sp. RAC02 TaxID=1842534 RepID=UPI0008580295|nr:ATP-binding protein [Sinorhizobium sp. RAC02]AOF92422.1 zeta toxin family protein [Sinorhizobium sp. RAC02]
MPKSPTLYLTCGLPGSGKTTLAKQLEQSAGAIRLTGDDWLQALFPEMTTDEAENGPLRAKIEKLQWRVALRALELGCNVIVDWGIWSRKERDDLRNAALSVGAKVILCLLDPPLAELWERVSRRNEERPFGAFQMTEADLIRWSHLFERPAADELAQYNMWIGSDSHVIMRKRSKRKISYK